ncbi:MAG: hypothetical protein ACKVOU_09350 [Cytophagales bacterium]
MKILQQLTAEQQHFFRDCIGVAFENSASAFSKFLNKDVKIKSLAIVSDFENNPSTLVADNIYILVSELRGKIRGKCYLNFTEKDANVLFQLALLPSYVNDKTMQKAILLELDNILTASVVSILSNTFKISSYAFVPELFVGNNNYLEKLLKRDYVEKKLILQFNTGFTIANHDFESEFIWIFDQAILEIVESHFNGLEQQPTVSNI